MKHLFKHSLFTLLFFSLFFSCSKQEMENINLAEKVSYSSDVVIGAYDISDFTVDEAGTTWTFKVQRVGEPQANGLSHLVLGFNYCPGFTSEGPISITSSMTDVKIEYSEGRGTECGSPTNPFFFKFDELTEIYSDGNVHIFSFTTSEPLKIENFDVWVKYGDNCASGLVDGLLCEPIVVEDPSCSLSQGYWFEKPGDWASKGYSAGTIKTGKYTYTEAEAMAIRNSTNSKSGMLDAKMAFLQVATILLSDAKNNSLTDEATVWPLVSGAISYLDSLPKLATTSSTGKISLNISTTKDANSYGGAIGDWIDANHCED